MVRALGLLQLFERQGVPVLPIEPPRQALYRDRVGLTGALPPETLTGVRALCSRHPARFTHQRADAKALSADDDLTGHGTSQLAEALRPRQLQKRVPDAFEYGVCNERGRQGREKNAVAIVAACIGQIRHDQ